MPSVHSVGDDGIGRVLSLGGLWELKAQSARPWAPSLSGKVSAHYVVVS
jgi:hypothetical protein